MSQFFKAFQSGSSPTIPTSFITDDGTAVPADNELNILGDDTTENNVNGITTTGSGDTVTVLLTNRVSLTAITSDGGGQTQSVTLVTPDNDTGFTFRVLVNAYDATNNETAGGELIGMGRKEVGSVTIIAENDVFSDSDLALAATEWDIIANGGDVDIQVVGVAGRTIVWRCLYEYIQSP